MFIPSVDRDRTRVDFTEQNTNNEHFALFYAVGFLVKNQRKAKKQQQQQEKVKKKKNEKREEFAVGKLHRCVKQEVSKEIVKNKILKLV